MLLIALPLKKQFIFFTHFTFRLNSLGYQEMILSPLRQGVLGLKMTNSADHTVKIIKFRWSQILYHSLESMQNIACVGRKINKIGQRKSSY